MSGDLFAAAWSLGFEDSGWDLPLNVSSNPISLGVKYRSHSLSARTSTALLGAIWSSGWVSRKQPAREPARALGAVWSTGEGFRERPVRDLGGFVQISMRAGSRPRSRSIVAHTFNFACSITACVCLNRYKINLGHKSRRGSVQHRGAEEV